jgi:uncharacterized tellurite resistance protein B-like protein
MDTNEQLLAGHSAQEKGAYLVAIASIATADRAATSEEIEFLQALAQGADLTEADEQVVLQAAQDPNNTHLRQSLEVLKNSELRFSLVTDLIAFAKADGKYTPDEEKLIGQMAQYLNINPNQYSAINQYVNQAETAHKQGQDFTSQNFLQSSGLGNTFQKSGINGGAMMKGMIGILAPMVIGGMLSRRRGGGMMGGGLGGGLMGGLLGGVLSGGMRNRGMGGMGGMFDVLSGGRGYGGMGGSGGLGGLLGGLLGGGGSRRGGFGF